MTDPPRLLSSDDGLTELERRVLSAGREMAPSAPVTAEVWASITARVGPYSSDGPYGHGESLAPESGSSAGSSSAGAAESASVATAKAMLGSGLVGVPAKFFLVGALVGGLTTGGAAWVRSYLAEDGTAPALVDTARASAARRPLAPGTAPVRTTPTVAAEPLEQAAPAIVPRRLDGGPVRETMHGRVEASSSVNRATDVSPGAGAGLAGPPAVADMAAGSPEPDPVLRQDRLEGDFSARDEALVVTQARDALRNGNPRAVLGLLERADGRFPAGILVQEREALLIEALAMSGNREAASQRARQFLAMHPESPHAAHVRAFVR